ncbi:hypothetical protein A2U01_0113815, partial [Trifolium medium]|nr:hypothetical protein [Trifolium medium]
ARQDRNFSGYWRDSASTLAQRPSGSLSEHSSDRTNTQEHTLSLSENSSFAKRAHPEM